MLSDLQIRMIGSLRATSGKRELLLPPGKQGELFAYFAIHCGERRSIDAIMDALWGEALPSGGVRTLRFHISKLRAFLRGFDEDLSNALTTEQSAYVFRVDPHQTDVSRFEDLAQSGRNRAPQEPAEARRLLAAALDIASGELLPAFSDRQFAIPSIRRFNELKLMTTEEYFDTLLRDTSSEGRSEAAKLPAEIEELLAIESNRYRERLWGQLMVGRYRISGQRDALAVYQRARGTFEEVGLDSPASLRDLETQVLLRQDAVLGPAPAVAVETDEEAPPDGVVGRDEQIDRIIDVLATRRIVTLTGAGGVGKTTLARVVARRLQRQLPDGAHFVSFESVEPQDRLPLHLAGSLSGTGMVSKDAESLEAIARGLVGKRMLLVLDNCEHVADEAARMIATLHEEAANLQLLVTSRVPLRLASEVIFRVPSLDVPVGPVAATAEDEPSGAGRLLLRLLDNRAGLHELDPHQRDIAGKICRALSGIPLALELVAARVDTLTLAGVGERLDDQLELLRSPYRDAPERHATIRATLDWGYRLLNDVSAEALCAVSVFRGGFGMRDAEEVCASAGLDPVGENIGALVEASFVVAHERARPRFSLLEPVRLYAREQATLHGILERVRAAHAARFMERMAEVGAMLETEPQVAIERLGPDLDNVREALRYALAKPQTDRVVGFVVAFAGYCDRVGLHAEIAFWLREFAEAGKADALPGRSGLLYEMAYFASLRGDLEEARLAGNEQDALAEALQSKEARALVKAQQADAEFAFGDTSAATDLYAAATELFEELDDPRTSSNLFLMAFALTQVGRPGQARQAADRAERWCITHSQNSLLPLANDVRTHVAFWEGDLATAQRFGRQAVMEWRQLGISHYLASSLRELADVLLFSERTTEAEELALEAIQINRDLGDARNVSRCKTLLGAIQCRNGDWVHGAMLLESGLGGAEQARDRRGSVRALIELAWAELALGNPSRATSLLDRAVAVRIATATRLAHPIQQLEDGIRHDLDDS